MEIRTQSQTGPVVPPLTEITATLSQQIQDMTGPLLDRLHQDPARFSQIEVEIHDRFRQRADPLTASLLATATISPTRAEPEKKGGLESTHHGVPRRRDG
ncbi:hypothetical protein BH23PLA1_BH23PLA1_36890 [soil metagenome]